jgi:hypothetical protein
MEQKKKNIQELLKMGLSKKTVSLMTESEIKLLFEKINKKKETKEATQSSVISTLPDENEKINMSVKDAGAVVDSVRTKKPLQKKGQEVSIDLSKVSSLKDISDTEVTEGKKKSKKKANPWAICTSSIGRKNKKKYEDCVMSVKKNIKEGKNPYEFIIESKMEEIVENNLSPRITKSELMKIIQEKKMMMKKPIGKMMSMKGETMEAETAPAREEKKTKEREKTRPSHPGKNPSPGEQPAPKAMEDKKDKIIKFIEKILNQN